MVQPVIDFYSDALAEYSTRRQVDLGNPILETRKLTVIYDNYLTAVQEMSI